MLVLQDEEATAAAGGAATAPSKAAQKRARKKAAARQSAGAASAAEAATAALSDETTSAIGRSHGQRMAPAAATGPPLAADSAATKTTVAVAEGVSAGKMTANLSASPTAHLGRHDGCSPANVQMDEPLASLTLGDSSPTGADCAGAGLDSGAAVAASWMLCPITRVHCLPRCVLDEERKQPISFYAPAVRLTLEGPDEKP